MTIELPLHSTLSRHNLEGVVLNILCCHSSSNPVWTYLVLVLSVCSGQVITSDSPYQLRAGLARLGPPGRDWRQQDWSAALIIPRTGYCQQEKIIKWLLSFIMIKTHAWRPLNPALETIKTEHCVT